MLKITISVVPPKITGIKEFKYCEIFASNDMTGSKDKGNYDVHVDGVVIGDGWDEWHESRMKLTGIDRTDYFKQACETMKQLNEKLQGNNND